LSKLWTVSVSPAVQPPSDSPASVALSPPLLPPASPASVPPDELLEPLLVPELEVLASEPESNAMQDTSPESQAGFGDGLDPELHAAANAAATASDAMTRILVFCFRIGTPLSCQRIREAGVGTLCRRRHAKSMTRP
jgi:hypothetical protein